MSAGKSKSEVSFDPQLVLNELVVPPGAEWSPQQPGWLVIHVCSGVGYWLGERLNEELQPGNVIVSRQSQGCVRASQVGELRLQFFRAEPGELTGLVTLGEQKTLQELAADKAFSLRVLPPSPQLSEIFKKIGARTEMRQSLRTRACLLALFVETFGDRLESPGPETRQFQGAGSRLGETLSQMSVARLIGTSLSELVGQTGCSARHVSRLFTEMVGVSFREKQVELRLARACELLATTDIKVFDVAEQSGYPSISFFNLVFKRQFGVSPAKWRLRAQAQARKPERSPARRSNVL